MICARASINADTGASLFYISFAEAEYFQPCNALAYLNPSANSNNLTAEWQERGVQQGKEYIKQKETADQGPP